MLLLLHFPEETKITGNIVIYKKNIWKKGYSFLGELLFKKIITYRMQA